VGAPVRLSDGVSHGMLMWHGVTFGGGGGQALPHPFSLTYFTII